MEVEVAVVAVTTVEVVGEVGVVVVVIVAIRVERQAGRPNQGFFPPLVGGLHFGRRFVRCLVPGMANQ